MAYSDEFLVDKINELNTAVEAWARSHDLWYDCGFSTYLKRVNAEPPYPPVVSIMWFEGPLYNVLSQFVDDALYEEFEQLVASLGYEHENIDVVTIAFYARDEKMSKRFYQYLHWQWVCSLITEDTADVYHELYEEFAKRPELLQRLGWRDFETLLFRIFQNHGFEAFLGPGRGDEGVDLRLVQRAPLGDVLTVVQAKRYAPKRKVGQTEVAALYGAGRLENAGKALFVTTSTYAPVSRRWAARTNGYLELADAEDVVRWCAKATAGIIADKSSLVSLDHVTRLISAASSRRADPRVVHASGGWNITDNWFALVLKESKHAALLMSVPKSILNHDGYGQLGTHVPQLDASTIDYFNSDNVWRAKRYYEDGKVRYWDGKRLYHRWDGKPCDFNLCD